MPTAGTTVKMVSSTRAKYNAIATKDDNTLYFVHEPDNSRVLYLGNILINEGLLDDKQDKLVSGTNIKTVNGNPLLGSGNITIAGGGGLTSVMLVSDGAGGIQYTSLTISNPTQYKLLALGFYYGYETVMLRPALDAGYAFMGRLPIPEYLRYAGALDASVEYVDIYVTGSGSVSTSPSINPASDLAFLDYCVGYK